MTLAASLSGGRIVAEINIAHPDVREELRRDFAQARHVTLNFPARAN